MYHKVVGLVVALIAAGLVSPTMAFPPLVPPPIVSWVTATDEGAMLRWSWLDDGGTALDGFDVYRFVPGELLVPVAFVPAVAGQFYYSHLDAEHNPAFPGLYAVSAVRGTQSSLPSNWVPAMPVHVETAQPLTVPGPLFVNVTEDRVELRWSHTVLSVPGTVQGYNVYRFVVGVDTVPEQIGTVPFSHVVQTYLHVDQHYVPEAFNVYFVRAFYGESHGPPSTPVTTYPPCRILVLYAEEPYLEAYPHCIIP